MNNTNIPESPLFQAIREAAKIGARVRFIEKDLGDQQTGLEVKIQAVRGDQVRGLSRLVGHEKDAESAIRAFVHELT